MPIHTQIRIAPRQLAPQTLEEVLKAEVRGIQVPVVRSVAGQGAWAGLQGIGTSVIFDPFTGRPCLAITLRHLDGDMVTALLDERATRVLADMMAVFVEAVPSLASCQSKARH